MLVLYFTDILRSTVFNIFIGTDTVQIVTKTTVEKKTILLHPS